MTARIAKKLDPKEVYPWVDRSEISGTDCPAVFCSLCLKQTPSFGRYCMNCGALLIEGGRGKTFDQAIYDEFIVEGKDI